LGAEADLSAVEPPSAVVLWIGILAGPIAWATNLLVGYALAHWTCNSQHQFVLHLFALGALIVTAAGASAALHSARQIPRETPTEGGRPIDRSRFMALLGLMMSALFATVLIATVVAQWGLDACR
jgi:hypothetical protein